MSDNSDTMSIHRLLRLPRNHSFFLLGPRGTGKSTLLRSWRKTLGTAESATLFLDLLDPDLEARYSVRPALLREEIEANKKLKWVILDEVQKIPTLLDVAHWAIEARKIHFALTGSSARKLKRGRGNLLAGRAFNFQLDSLTHRELAKNFDLDEALRWGTLPTLLELPKNEDKVRYLTSYAQTYLKEEIQVEQLVRRIERFRQFLPFAAQANATVLNFSKISGQSGVDEKSIQRYFEILEETLIGFWLEPFQRSVRKRQLRKPKFYLFDTGVARALDGSVRTPLNAGTSIYGHLFETWIVGEIRRLSAALEKGFELSYLTTKDGVEIDLIVERPGQSLVLIEIKSSTQVTVDDCRHLRSLGAEFPKALKWVVSREKTPRKASDGIEILPWRTAFERLF